MVNELVKVPSYTTSEFCVIDGNRLFCTKNNWSIRLREYISGFLEKHISYDINKLKERIYEETIGENRSLYDHYLWEIIEKIRRWKENRVYKVHTKAIVLLENTSELIDFFRYIRNNAEHPLNRFLEGDFISFYTHGQKRRGELYVPIPTIKVRESIVPFMESNRFLPDCEGFDMEHILEKIKEGFRKSHEGQSFEEYIEDWAKRLLVDANEWYNGGNCE